MNITSRPSPAPMCVWVDGAPLTGRITGVQRYVESLLMALQREDGVDLRAFRFAGDRPARGGGLGLRWRTALAHRRVYSLFARRLVAPPLDLLLRTRPAVFLFPAFVAFPVTSFSKSVAVIHDLSFYTVPEHSKTDNLRKRVPLTIRRADHIVTVSRFAANEIVERFPEARTRISVVYPAADARFAPSSVAAQAAFRARIGVEHQYLLFVGTLEPRKNVVGVLDAYEGLPADVRARTPLLISGGRGWRDEEIIRRLERGSAYGVRQLGYVDDVDLPLLYGAARALVFPSFYEGFGLPPLEALACGTPAIASSTTALPEAVGEGGLLVNPRDTGALRDAMRRVVEDDALRADLSARGLIHARSFSWEAAAHQLVTLFRSL